MLGAFTKGDKLEKVAKPRQGLATADNNRFIREWWEVSQSKSKLTSDNAKDRKTPVCDKWFPYNKGGEYRKWYGNQDYVINWENNGQELYDFKPKSVIRNPQFYFQSSVSWSNVSSGTPSFRYYPEGFIFSHVGDCLFPKDELDRDKLIAICNASVTGQLLAAMAPTLHFEVGQVAKLPIANLLPGNWTLKIDNLIQNAKDDWNTQEISWNFSKPILFDEEQTDFSSGVIEELVKNVRSYWAMIASEQQQLEIDNNIAVADAYGVRDDVPCDVPLERVSLKRNVAFAYPKDTPEVRNEKFAQDVVKELISYAVGCMFGRYSLDKPGLILASQGETLDDYHAQIPNPSFEPDADNVIPVTETDCFEDDIVTRFRRFLTVAFGKENLAANIAYIEQVLGKSIRKYFVNDFYNDHVRMYSNRPIYWQYSSQTNNKGSFKALVYLHRYTPKTTNVVLNYLRDYANKIADIADSLERSDRTADKKQAAKLRKAILECKDYEDQTLYPLATRNLEMDLDDGVLVNYLRMGKALRSIPAIEKKRKEVSTWTWPVHPLKEEDKEVRNGKE